MGSGSYFRTMLPLAARQTDKRWPRSPAAGVSTAQIVGGEQQVIWLLVSRISGRKDFLNTGPPQPATHHTVPSG